MNDFERAMIIVAVLASAAVLSLAALALHVYDARKQAKYDKETGVRYVDET